MAGSAAGARTGNQLSPGTLAAAFGALLLFLCASTAGVSGKVQKQVVMFHHYPVRVDVDLEARTAIVSPPDNIPGIGRSRTFYDYNTRVIAYKDYRAKQCHLERMSPDEKLPGTDEDSGEKEQREEEEGPGGLSAAEREAERRLHRQMALLGPTTQPRSRQKRAPQNKANQAPRRRPKTLYVTETVLSKYKVLRLAGRRIAHFCRGYPATLLVRRPPVPPSPQLQPPSRVPWLSENELPGEGDEDEEHRLLLEEALVKARLAELEMQTLDHSEEDDLQGPTKINNKGSRSKRQAPGNGGNRGWNWPRKFRGQTQSQFVSFNGEGKTDGTAQAESRPEGTTTLVRGANGMGQSQSQSSVGDDCEGCFPGGLGGVGYSRGPWQQPGYATPGGEGGRIPAGAIVGPTGAVAGNGISGVRGPGAGTVGGRVYPQEAGYGRPGAGTPGAIAATPGGQNGNGRPGAHRPGTIDVAGGPGYPGGSVPSRDVVGARPGYGSTGNGGVVGPPGRPGYAVPGRDVDQGYGRPGVTNGHRGTLHGVGGPGYTAGGPGYEIQPGDLIRTPGFRPGGDIHGHPGNGVPARPQNGVYPGGRPGYGTTSHAGVPGYLPGVHGVGRIPRPGTPGTPPSDSHHVPGHRVHGGAAQPGVHTGYPTASGHHIVNGHRVTQGGHGIHVPGQYTPSGSHDGHHLRPGTIQRPHDGAHDYGAPGYDSTHIGGRGDGRYDARGLISPSGLYPGAHIPAAHGGQIGSQGIGIHPSAHGIPGHGLYGPGTGRGHGPEGAPGRGHVSGNGYRGYPSASGGQGSGVTPGIGGDGHGVGGIGAGPGAIGLGPGRRPVGSGGRPVGTGAGVGPSGGGVGPGEIGVGPGARGITPGGEGIGPGRMGMRPGLGDHRGGIIPGAGVGPGAVVRPGTGMSPGAGLGPGAGVGPGVGVGHGQGIRVGRPSIGSTGHGAGLGPGVSVGPTGSHHVPSGSGVYIPGGADGRGHVYPSYRPDAQVLPHGIGDTGRHPSHVSGYDTYPTGATGHRLPHGITGPGRDGLYRGAGTHIPEAAITGHLVPETIIGLDTRYLNGGTLRPGVTGLGLDGGHRTVGVQRPDDGLSPSQTIRPHPGGPGYVNGQRVPGYGVATPGYGPGDGRGQYERPGYYDGQGGPYSMTRPGPGARGPSGTPAGESQAQSSVIQDDKEVKAGASSQGKLGDGKAQAQVSGSYSGTGSFSAQAQTSDGGRSAQSQVTGNKDGGSSSAQGNGGAGQSQAQVQLSSANGATKAEAQSGGRQHGSNTQVQAGENGGMADAQSSGPGTTSSQAQVGFKPYRANGNGNGQRTPFRGGGTASAQSGSFSGQSQSQVQGSYRYGVTFQGAAQAGSGVRGSRGIGGGERNGTRFERDDHAALIPDSVKLPPLKKFTDISVQPETSQFNGNNKVRQNANNGLPLSNSPTPVPLPPHPTHQRPGNGQPSMPESNQQAVSTQNGNHLINGHSQFSESGHRMHGSHSQGSPSRHHTAHNSYSSSRQYNSHDLQGSSHLEGNSNNNAATYGSESSTQLTQDTSRNQNNLQQSELGSGHRQEQSEFPKNSDKNPTTIPHTSVHGSNFAENSDSGKTQVFKTEAPRQSQAVFVSPTSNEDVHITQASDGGGIPAQAVYQPGELVPGTSGFIIPQGFRGRVIGDSRSIAGDETLAIASPNNGNSQSQTVVVTPGSGKVNYTRIVRPPSGKPVVPAYDDYGENQDDSENHYDIPTQRSGQRINSHRSSDVFTRGDQPSYSWTRPKTRNGDTNPQSSYKDEDDFDDDSEDDEEDDDIEEDEEEDEREDEVQPTSPPPILNSYVSVTKSVSGQLNPIHVPQGNYDRQFQNGNSGLLGSNGGKFAHTYYTKSSTCGYFTFSCNVVFGSNGRAKICKPRLPTNPDGTPCCC